VAGMGTLAVFILMGIPSASIVMSLSLFAVAMLRLMPAFSRVQYYLATIKHSDCTFEEIYNDLTQVKTELKDSDLPPLKLEKSIKIKDLSFAYEKTNKIFDGFNVEIPRLSSVAFIGPTGCGKTTVVDILLGLLKPDSGKILVDGRDIEENLASWQKSIGYVPQFIYLTDDSIKANVAFGVLADEIDNECVRECLKTAQILDFIESLPDGVDTLVGERGVRLSGGQRQRIGIARALYHNPEILILDEATSALDNETEKAFVDALGALKGKLTMIIIAHRLSTVENCDIKIKLK
jgi:ABC-type multidrug transport system fused ATPase/permease subunit